jgi:hypothetical protein
MVALQEWIYRLELGQGARLLKRGTLILGLLFVTVIYDWREYKNFGSPEAMDLAQTGRNIAAGRGFSTRYIRPLSAQMVAGRSADKDARLRTHHPDLANAPVYPLVLAGLMTVLPFDFEIHDRRTFRRYEPEIYITALNQAFLLAAAALLFVIARRLFDRQVAWLSAVVLLGTAQFWRFSTSGLPVLLLVVIFLGMLWCLLRLDAAVPGPVPEADSGDDAGRAGGGTSAASAGALAGASDVATPSGLWHVAHAGALGALVGLGTLTRYGFGWLLLPVLGYLMLVFPARRVQLMLSTAAAFLLVVSPWIARNYALSGAPFGTAGYAAFQETSTFQGGHLERSIKPDWSRVTLRQVGGKTVENLRVIVSEQLPRLGGNWTAMFFFVGLLVPYRNPALTRLRRFTVASLALLVLVQAAGATHLSVPDRELTSENLSILVAPVVYMLGISLLVMLVDQLALPPDYGRSLVLGAWVLVASAPLVLLFLPPRSFPFAYPPYHPPEIQVAARMMHDKELLMSDIPWAVAWYGDRQCIWLTLNSPGDATNDFFVINDFYKPIQAIYLTPVTTDRRLLTEAMKSDRDWGRFATEVLFAGKVPARFPLQKMPNGFYPDSLFITDRERE